MKKNLKKLVKKAEDANEAYRSGCPFISDNEYDIIIDGIKKIDPKNEFANSVEIESKGSRDEFAHEIKMLSMDKTYDIDGIVNFIQKCRKVKSEFCIYISPKLDGVASRRYKNNVFVTRGDGDTGHIIPKKISKYLNPITNQDDFFGIEPSGEIVVSETNFQKYLKDDYTHPRNFVAGLINTDSLNEIQAKALEKGIVEFVSHEKQINHLNITINKDSDDLTIIYWVDKAVRDIKENNIYPIDGIVFTIKDEEIRNALGNTNHHYCWQIALKENSETGRTTVEDILYQVGRTGVCTPVLKIKPIKLSGAMISSVTAHNVQILINEGIGVGSEIEIVRSGEVIPKIIDVIRRKDPFIPKYCPSCGIKLIRDGLFLKCPYEMCQGRLVQSVFHWFKCLDNSDWFGLKTIQKLSRNGYYLIEKIYDMDKGDFRDCDFGGVQSKNLWESVELSKAKQIPDWKLLAAFGILGVERGLSKRILKKYKINELTSLKKEDIIAINGFGDKVSNNFIEYMNKNKDMFNRMIQKFNLKHSSEKKKIKSIYSGKKMLFTGSVEGYSRDQIKEIFEINDMISVTSVSKNVDMVVSGDKPGKSKIKKANELGIEIIEFKEFMEKLNEKS